VDGIADADVPELVAKLVARGGAIHAESPSTTLWKSVLVAARCRQPRQSGRVDPPETEA